MTDAIDTREKRATASMRAVRIHEFGGPDVLRVDEVPRPDPVANEVVVETHAVGTNPMDRMVRRGEFDSVPAEDLPVAPGGDVAGVVHAVGDEVDAFAPGDEVYGTTRAYPVGAYAEYVVATPETIAPTPSTLDHVHAAAVPTVAATAHEGLFDVGELAAGDEVLIHGAAGGVGSFAVQFAADEGAHVVATAAAEDLAYVRDLGADEAIDYETAFEEQVSGMDLVLDVVGGETRERSWQVLAPDGLLVTTLGPAPDEAAERHDRRGELFFLDTRAADLAGVATAFDAGDLSVTVGATRPLADARAAHELATSDAAPRGKVVLDVGD